MLRAFECQKLDFYGTNQYFPNLEGPASANNMESFLGGRRGWDRLTEGEAHVLHGAWWGKGITTRNILTAPNPDDDIEDVNDVSTPLQPIVHTIVDLDQGIGRTTIGPVRYSCVGSL